MPQTQSSSFNQMVDATLGSNYIKNIPWKKHPLFAFSKSAEAYMQAFENVFGPNVELNDKTAVNFDDDRWDFNKIFKTKNTHLYRIVFTSIPEEIKLYAKFFVLNKICSKSKISTIQVRLTDAITVINRIKKKIPNATLYTIDTQDIIDAVEESGAKPTTKHNNYEGIYQFLSFIISNYHLKLLVDLDKIKELGIKNKNLSKKNQEEDKLPNIPDKYLAAIIHTATETMRDASESHNMRAVACMIIILSQTGFRLGDALALTLDRLKHTTIGKNKLEVNYIHYIEHKVSTEEVLLEMDVVSSPLCTEAWNILAEIKKDVKQDTQDFLFTLADAKNGLSATYPISNTLFNRHYKAFMYKKLNSWCTKEWEEIKPTVHDTRTKAGKLIIYVPDSRQYRVAISTYFYNHGVPLLYIQRYMGHLSEIMIGYYVRPKDDSVEDAEFTEKTLHSIIVDNETPLGFMGKEMKDRIREFLEEQEINIYGDIRDIVNALGDRVIIRAKEGGMCTCIKTSLIPCAEDARSNEILCATGDCPNIYTFYYHLDISLIDFYTACDAYTHNIEAGRMRDAQHELAKIRDICRRRLIKQLDELDRKLNELGEDKIIEKHPSLQDAIRNKETIRKDVDLWMKKKK